MRTMQRPPKPTAAQQFKFSRPRKDSPPDTKEEREEKERLKQRWLAKHNVTRCACVYRPLP